MTLKRIAGLALAIATAVVAVLIYMQSALAGGCIAVLAGVLALGAILDRRAHPRVYGDDFDGRKAAYRGIAARQARAMARREDGEISGAPSGQL